MVKPSGFVRNTRRIGPPREMATLTERIYRDVRRDTATDVRTFLDVNQKVTGKRIAGGARSAFVASIARVAAHFKNLGQKHAIRLMELDAPIRRGNHAATPAEARIAFGYRRMGEIERVIDGESSAFSRLVRQHDVNPVIAEHLRRMHLSAARDYYQMHFPLTAKERKEFT